MSRALLTPLDTTAVVDLGRSTFRKKLLHVGDLRYGDRTLHFTPDYLRNLVASFTARAFDAVPLQLADGDNKHNADPTRTRGQVTGLEATSDGLYATVSLTDDGAALVREHPELGVSARIVEDLQRGDGQSWPAALEHVLATWNPRVNALGPWQAVEASNTDVDEVLDLTTPAEPADPPASPPDTTGGPPVPDTQETAPALSAAEIAKFREWMAAEAAAPVEEEADPTVLSDEDLAALAEILAQDADGEEGTDPTPATPATTPATATPTAPVEPVTVSASADHAGALELANQRTDALEVELSTLRRERDVQAYEQERDRFARENHIPPRITDLAKPLLLGRRTVELSNGSTVDPGEIVRTLLRSLGEHMEHLDLSAEAGTVFDTSRVEQDKVDDAGRMSVAAAYLAQYGI